MAITPTSEHAHKLIKFLEDEFQLPKGCYSLRLTIKVGEAVTIECGFYPDEPEKDEGQK